MFTIAIVAGAAVSYGRRQRYTYLSTGPAAQGSRSASLRQSSVLSAAQGDTLARESNSRFSFGVIADVQWADSEDGFNFKRTVRRHYRGALKQLEAAVSWWKGQQPTFVVQLGDLIDGKNAQAGQSQTALDGATRLLSTLTCRVVHLIGNHELYNFDRSTLATKIDTRPSPDNREFFAFQPAQGWRVLVLDSYHESLMGWPEDDERKRRAERTLAENNPNDLAKGDNWFKGLHGLERRFVPFNGALGQQQLKWLRQELNSAAAARERVILLSHAILHPCACDGTTMIWDYPQALEAIRENRNVAMVICGHDHKGGYHCDEHGVHHITLCSPLNLGESGKAFGIMEIHDSSVDLHGPCLDDLLPSHATDLPAAMRSWMQGCQVKRFPLHPL
mmetsp:Transcript_111776/g.193223  ORF Transcript_111776/g.193223 Transcript_111776/m.193223 type:complete len:390 (+) Transcript_111776:78-1247(+)